MYRPCCQQEYPVFLQAILDGLTDGVLLLTARGELVYANRCARQMCVSLGDNASPTLEASSVREMWGTLLERCRTISQPPSIVETEIRDRKASLLRVRARWLDLKESDPYLLITLEDYNQSLQNLAITEVDRYNLTPREAEVWTLRRTGATYKEIALQLYIAVDTVKKHLKNIHAKREEALDIEQL
jgi:DNA-binding CsgD family transcriptional regulator